MLIGIDANEANLTQSRVGINQYAHSLLKALYSANTNHQFVIYLKNPPLADLPDEKPGWQYRVIPFPKLWTQTRLPFDLFTHKPRPDVFFSLTHYAPRWAPMPTVISIMDLGFLHSPEQFTAKDLNQLKSWTGYSVRQAAKVIAISQATKNDIESAYQIDPNKIFITYLGFDSESFKPTVNRSILNKYGIGTPYILFLSSLKPSKNIERLVQAFSQLDRPNLNLVIAGKKAWMYEQIFKLVHRLKLDNKVIFTGFVDESDVPSLMTQAECFALPSLFEGFGIPVLEAMASGTPVVTSNVASLPEVGGEAAIYVDPVDVSSIANGLTRAMSDERQKFVELGLNRVKSFNWNKCAQETLSVLNSCLENKYV